ncbi:hypothetical protein [Apibacter muscae]|uniref:hypothetical protein n=1 Tax=Apibacter muscae TaxID=2509004 RepID=UPI0021AA3412|nr:hypothetical protein [Apibacter muscae]
MKITLLLPMKEEKEKMLEAFQQYSSLRHIYEIIETGVGRENMAKGFLEKKESDLTVLVGFTAITGIEKTLPIELKKGKLVEVTSTSIYGYKGEIFENGSIKLTNSRTSLPCLSSLTTDQFIRSTDLPIGTLINMEDYTFMCLKKPKDLIIRVISDFLPHNKEIDFFKEIEDIEFYSVVELLEKLY